jgi:hypothetical protein
MKHLLDNIVNRRTTRTTLKDHPKEPLLKPMGLRNSLYNSLYANCIYIHNNLLNVNMQGVRERGGVARAYAIAPLHFAGLCNRAPTFRGLMQSRPYISRAYAIAPLHCNRAPTLQSRPYIAIAPLHCNRAPTLPTVVF